MYKLTGKGEQIQRMFSTIAPRYDFLNRLLSLGIDRRWRRVAVGLINCPPRGRVLDVATGTGDVALEIAAQTPDSVAITGIDFSSGMVEHGRTKIAASAYRDRITLQIAPCEEIPFPDDTFDAATIAFGIRNVVDRQLGLSEMRRVLKPGGRVVILEFSNPRSQLFKLGYNFYFHRILPLVAGLFSQQSAYRYLPESVMEFPSREEFAALMTKAGYRDVTFRDLTFGIATIYIGVK